MVDVDTTDLTKLCVSSDTPEFKRALCKFLQVDWHFYSPSFYLFIYLCIYLFITDPLKGPADPSPSNDGILVNNELQICCRERIQSGVLFLFLPASIQNASNTVTRSHY
jgi:hypothetical protein